MSLAVLTDHTADLADDHRRGRTRVQARPRSYAILGLASAGCVGWLIRRNSVVAYRVMRYVLPQLRLLIHDYHQSRSAAA